MTGATTIDLHSLLDAAGIPGVGSLADRVRLLVAENDRLNRMLATEAKRTTYDRLIAALDEDWSDVLRMLADDALDRGNEGEAKGWGWLAATGRWPVHVSSQKSWMWYGATDTELVGSTYSYILPERLAKALCAAQGLERYAVIRLPSCSAALLAVVNVIAAGKWSVETK